MICVIIIIGMLLILAIPNIANLIQDEEANISDAMNKVIIEAAELYVSQNNGIYIKTEGNVYCIKLQELIDNEYLSSPLKDPKTKKEINTNNFVKVHIENNKFIYEYTETCQVIENQ